ncbi:MAG: hypothetical protein ABEL97_15645 [Salinibacter sp.]
MRRALVLFAAVLLLMGGARPAGAQQADTTGPAVRGQGDGQVALTDWPASLSGLLDEMGRKAPYLLPKIDSLALDYRYAADDSTSQWSFVLGWQPGSRVLYEGEILPGRRAPAGIRMTNVELRAEVVADGEYVGDLIVAVDSMALAPIPSIYSFEVTVGHERLLLDASGAAARKALLEGARLEDLVVERMGFVSDAASTSERRRPSDARERRPEPRRSPSVYTPSTRIFIGWRVAPRPYYVDDRNGTRTVRPRRETVGRGGTGPEEAPRRTAERDDTEKSGGRARGRGTRAGSDDDDEEDEDDDTSLRLPALGAAAAVGLLAYAGGTVGLYGRGDTPLGLAAGYTQPGGGVHLQAAVNSAVVEGDDGQKLTVKALGFYDVFSSPIQPAAGLGVQIDPARDRDVAPAVSLGLAGNFGRIVVFGGVDLVQVTPEVGLTYNLRHGRGRSSDQSPTP